MQVFEAEEFETLKRLRVWFWSLVWRALGRLQNWVMWRCILKGDRKKYVR